MLRINRQQEAAEYPQNDDVEHHSEQKPKPPPKNMFREWKIRENVLLND